MTSLPLLSASQIQTSTECERKWFYKSIAKVPSTPHPSAVLGTEVQDTQLDPYLKDGRPFDFTRKSGEIANALVPLIPKPNAPGMVLRRWFEMPSPRGTFGYRGEFDLYASDSRIVPGVTDGRALVGDFKTTSNLTYTKNESDLAVDVQAQLYAMAVMFEENVDELDLIWFYVRTRTPHRVQRTRLTVRAPHVVEQFQRIDEIGSRLSAIKLANPKAEDMRPNVRMCEAYGGCPYRPICSGASNPTIQAAEVNKEMSFLDNLRKQVPPVQPAPEPAPAVDPASMFAPPPATEIPSWAIAPVDPRHAKPAINPPESALPPAPPVNVAPPAAPTEAPKKRGRPAKSQAEAGEGIALDDVVGLVTFMRTNGIKRLAFEGQSVSEIEVSS